MNPTDTQNFENNWIKSYEAAAQQPAANLESTETGITGEQQSIDIAKQKIDQQNFMTSAQAALDAASKTNGGYAPADLYNSLKGKAAAYGIGDGQFDGAFEQPYTNPNDINYRTTGGRSSQQALGQITRQIEDKLDKFNALPADQKGPLSLTGRVAEIPFIGSTLGQFVSPEATVYQGERTALAAQLKSLVGAGTGSGVRVTEQQLEGWSSLLPEATDSNEVAQDKIAALDKDIKATFNSKTGLDPKYLPSQQNGNTSNQGGDINNNNTFGVNNFTGNADLDKILSAAISNVPSDAAAIVKGTGDTAMNFLGKLTKEPLSQAIGDTAIPMGKSYVDTLASIFGVKTANGQPILDPNKSVLEKGGVNVPSEEDPKAALDFITKHPVTTVLSALPFLDGGPEEAPTGATGGEVPPTDVPTGEAPSTLTTSTNPDYTNATPKTEVPATNIPNLKGNPIMDFLKPGDQIARGGGVRDAIIQEAQDAGKSISNDDVLKDFNEIAPTLKRGNLGQGAIIDRAVQDAEAAYPPGETMTPQEAADAYKETASGFNKDGTPKTPIQANIDRAMRTILGEKLNGIAPGWDEATDEIAKGYDTQKSPLRKWAKIGAAATAGGIVPGEAGNILKQLIGGL